MEARANLETYTNRHYRDGLHSVRYMARLNGTRWMPQPYRVKKSYGERPTVKLPKPEPVKAAKPRRKPAPPPGAKREQSNYRKLLKINGVDCVCCHRCKVPKPLDDFYPNQRCRFKRDVYCKACKGEMNRECKAKRERLEAGIAA